VVFLLSAGAQASTAIASDAMTNLFKWWSSFGSVAGMLLRRRARCCCGNRV